MLRTSTLRATPGATLLRYVVKDDMVSAYAEPLAPGEGRMPRGANREPNWAFDPSDKSNAEIREEFAARLSYWMNCKGWSQSELGRRTATSRDVINRYARGVMMPKREKIKEICDALEISVGQISPQPQTSGPPTNEKLSGGIRIGEPDENGNVQLWLSVNVDLETAQEIVRLAMQNLAGLPKAERNG
jgi:transcriptional regulator with XRE-family HTH domain